MNIAVIIVVVLLLLCFLSLRRLCAMISWSKVISGVVLACIVLPTIYWGWGAAKETVNPDSMVLWLWNSGTQMHSMFLQLFIDAKYRELENKFQEKLAMLKAAEASLVGMPADEAEIVRARIADYRVECNRLLKEQEAIVAENAQSLIKVKTEMLANERSENDLRELRMAQQILVLTQETKGPFSRVELRLAGERFNEFIELLAERDLNRLEKVITPDLAERLNSKAALKQLLECQPVELDGGFRLLPCTDEGEALRVIAGEGRSAVEVATLARVGGVWLVDSLWDEAQ